MTTKSLFPLALALAFPSALRADQESLDALARQEQEQVDSEAVSVYGGEVGGAEAIFLIEWTGTGSPVEGRYYLPVRGRNFMYLWKGSNPKPGVLEVEEFLDDGTGKLVTNATCTLKKRLDGDRIVWEGEKTFENGRLITISFSRAK